MLVMRTSKDPTDPLGKLVSSQHSIGLHHLALAVNPNGLYGIQPRTLLGQHTAHDPHFLSTRWDFSVVRSEPAPDLPKEAPTGVETSSSRTPAFVSP